MDYHYEASSLAFGLLLSCFLGKDVAILEKRIRLERSKQMDLRTRGQYLQILNCKELLFNRIYNLDQRLHPDLLK